MMIQKKVKKSLQAIRWPLQEHNGGCAPEPTWKLRVRTIFINCVLRIIFIGLVVNMIFINCIVTIIRFLHSHHQLHFRYLRFGKMFMNYILRMLRLVIIFIIWCLFHIFRWSRLCHIHECAFILTPEHLFKNGMGNWIFAISCQFHCEIASSGIIASAKPSEELFPFETYILSQWVFRKSNLAVICTPQVESSLI